MALIPFRRRRKLEIEYIEEFKKSCYVIDFKGRSIEHDPIALCYLRVCKEVLLFYVGTGRHERFPARGKKDREAEKLPYVVFDTEDHLRAPSATTLLKHVEEIHAGAERLFEFCQCQGRQLSSSILQYDWRLR
jgi:hypothetical protein